MKIRLIDLFCLTTMVAVSITLLKVFLFVVSFHVYVPWNETLVIANKDGVTRTLHPGRHIIHPWVWKVKDTD